MHLFLYYDRRYLWSFICVSALFSINVKSISHLGPFYRFYRFYRIVGHPHFECAGKNNIQFIKWSNIMERERERAGRKTHPHVDVCVLIRWQHEQLKITNNNKQTNKNWTNYTQKCTTTAGRMQTRFFSRVNFFQIVFSLCDFFCISSL